MKQMNSALQANFDRMQATGKLFRSSVSGHKLWEVYHEGFLPAPQFRDPNSDVYNCNTCHSFINNYGNVVAIDPLTFEIMTIFDGIELEEYKKSCSACVALLKTARVEHVFVETVEHLRELSYELDNSGNRHGCKADQKFFTLGLAFNYKQFTKEEADKFGGVEVGKVYTFEHLYMMLKKDFVSTRSGVSIEAIRGQHDTNKAVFQRLIKETKKETLEQVLTSFKAGELWRPEDNIPKLEKLVQQASQYEEVPLAKDDNWLWLNSYSYVPLGSSVRELIKMVEDKDPKAYEKYNQMVDPANYQKQQRLASERQLQAAKKDFEEQGYMPSFDRRCATLDDIEPSLIEHLHNTEAKKASLFDSVPTASKKIKSFDGVQEMSYDEFKAAISGVKTIELYMENRLIPNLVSLTTANDKSSKRIFKWDNNFAWTYKGGLAGVSQIRAAVKSQGGFVDAPFRCSILWNDSQTPGICDFDLHCRDAANNHICYSSVFVCATPGLHTTSTGGQQDLDDINPTHVGVENIFWSSLSKLRDGQYKFWINLFNSNSNMGCKAEIFFQGKTWTFFFNKRFAYKENVDIATITIKNGAIESIQANTQYLVDGLDSSTKVWNISTNEFQTVNLMCVSPNYWGTEVGVKEHFFFLAECKADSDVKAFHIEHLNAELQKHRRVLDFLPAVCPSIDGQLSGIGFNNTVHNYAYFRIDGKRVVKVNF